MRRVWGKRGYWLLHTLLEFSNLTRYKTDVALPSFCHSTVFLLSVAKYRGSACMTRRGVKVGTCSLLFLRHMGKPFQFAPHVLHTLRP